MQALLEFIMRGRLQAASVALIGSWFPLVSPAVVALVSLRKGAFEGSLILVWAMLPTLLALVVGNQDLSGVEPIVAFMHSVGVINGSFGLLVVLLTALMLRTTVRWPVALMGAVSCSGASAILLAAFAPEFMQVLFNAFSELMRVVLEPRAEGANITPPSEAFVIGLVAYLMASSTIVSLLIARWCQAKLYNPGGFQTEFHQIRLAPVQAAVCGLGAAYCLLQPGGYSVWASLFIAPLTIAGVALIHAVVHARKMGLVWLVLTYLGLFLGTLNIVISVLAIADTWLNLRDRLKVKPPSND